MSEGITAVQAQAQEEYLANLRYYLEQAEIAATAAREDEIKGKIADLRKTVEQGEALNRMVVVRDELAELQQHQATLTENSVPWRAIQRQINILNRQLEREAGKL